MGESYEEAVEFATYAPLREMDLYFSEDENGCLPDLTEEQEREVFDEKALKYSIMAREYMDDGDATETLLDEIADRKFYDSVITVRVVSRHRILFEDEKELFRYYTENVRKVKPENRYDFLLALIDYEERCYDRHGNYLCSENHRQGESVWWRCRIPEFTLETAKDLKYTL